MCANALYFVACLADEEENVQILLEVLADDRVVLACFP